MVQELVQLTLGSSLGAILLAVKGLTFLTPPKQEASVLVSFAFRSDNALTILRSPGHSQECLLILSCPALSFLETRITIGGMWEHGIDIHYCPCHHCVLMSPTSRFLH